MNGLIPVIDRGGRQVARLTWGGTPWSGSGMWWYATEEIKGAIEGVRKTRADLGQVSFCDMYRDAGTCWGWKGFSGWLQALSIALPSIGLDVDDANLIWPRIKDGEDEIS